MRKRSESIVSFTTSELEARLKRGETASDWTKAASHAVPDGSDPDDAMEEIEWATTELPMPRPKVHASLRLDAEMLELFKGQGVAIRPRSTPFCAVIFASMCGEADARLNV